MTLRQKAKIKAIKNKLCKIDDSMMLIGHDYKDRTLRDMTLQRAEIDKCLAMLEGLLKERK